MDYIKNISRPRDTDLSDIPREPEPTFKPSKTKEAMNAMLNKRLRGLRYVDVIVKSRGGDTGETRENAIASLWIATAGRR